MARVSIITPWYNCPELIPTYEKSVKGAQVIIVDNASEPDTTVKLQAMIERLGNGSLYIRNQTNARYSVANNQGMEAATGDILIFMNNDIEAPTGWIDRIEVDDGALYGPSLQVRQIAGVPMEYIEGFCIAGTSATWEVLNGWDDATFQGMYWEDNDVCYRAIQMGYKLIETNWPVWHFGNYTSRNTDGAYDSSRDNYETFVQKVREGKHA